ncbi:regulatory protein UhpC [Klebsiella pneumoniae]|uniref:Regulatory protein UhpC n=1 Tax=Klebsiella pneumoniae TaxID=573 RepID=A0A2X3CLK6_KLEPN|nr:regulatory protein UhpC [Klebsiella pneumoniae]
MLAAARSPQAWVTRRGDWRHDALEIAQQQEGAGMSRKAILTRYVLANPYIWLLSLCYVLVYVVRRRLTTGAICICRRR